jgi:endonuclease/exonuclease/phosphatase family metal-dependent hydrolase
MKLPLGIAACFLWMAASASGITLMSYNVQNLFDDVRNGTEYREFDPARRLWTREFFRVRTDAIAHVVRSVVPGGPDILLLQEIENENALHALVDTGLRGMGYSWQILVPKKGLAATIAIVSRLPALRVRTLGVGPWKGGPPLRDILEAEIQAEGHTLHVFDNHWKSKTGGVKASEVSRRESAAVLGRRVREILVEEPGADIVAAGDFNECLDEYTRVGRKYPTALVPDSEASLPAACRLSIFLSSSTRQLGVAGERLVLYDPWFEVDAAGRGSFTYQGEWLTVDHFLLSPGLFDTRGFTYKAGSFHPARLPFLLGEDGTPKKWGGLKGEKGYSDHLPLLLTLEVSR